MEVKSNDSQLNYIFIGFAKNAATERTYGLMKDSCVIRVSDMNSRERNMKYD